MVKREHKPLTISVVRALHEQEKPVYLEFEKLEPAGFEIPEIVDYGEPVLYVRAKDFIGIVPNSKFSIQKIKPSKRVVGKTRAAYVYGEFQLTNPDDSTTPLVIFSTKDYQAEKKVDVLNEIESAEFITAKVMSFNTYGTQLLYKGLVLEMNNRSFTNKVVSPDTVLTPGDEIDVKFRKYRNRKQKIIVDPVVAFPVPSYEEALDFDKIEVGKVFNAEIRKLEPTYIIVKIGRDNSEGKFQPILVRCRHPHPVVSQYLAVDIPVRVKIVKKSTGKQLAGSIIDIDRDFVDDNILEYRRAIEERQAQLHADSTAPELNTEENDD